MISKIIAQGAEAIIEKRGRVVIKKRIVKSYRHPELDEKLRKLRTRAESKLIEKASSFIPTTRVLSANEKSKEITLEYIAGKKLADSLDKIKNLQVVAKQIGTSIAKLHDSNIIHGDLTTSNMILKNNIVYFIDFGLGFQSSRIEDKAVDLHVLKEALEARHPKIWQKAWTNIIKGYRKSPNSSLILKQLEKVEKRGRYKAQY